MKHICIYCKEEKEESDFNTEHVIPRQYGTYNCNAPVLNQYQVCKECNSYFSHELENVVGLDSIEAFYRMQFGPKTMSDGRSIKRKRLNFEIINDRLRDISPNVITNSSKPEKIEFIYDKWIGIHRDCNEYSYDYYHLEDLPDASEEIKERIKKYPEPIFTIGITEEESRPILIQRCYIDENTKFSYVNSNHVFGDDDQITVKLIDVDDSIKRRLAAKTVLNYLCYKFGSDYVLGEKFDDIRNYVRYGVWNPNKLWFKFQNTPYSFCDLPNDHAHAVGWAWRFENNTSFLMGIVTWFGCVTYEFVLYEDRTLFDDTIKVIPKEQMLDTWMLYGDNDKRQATEENSWFIILNKY